MSTIASAVFNHDSDDDNDPDFVPEPTADSDDEVPKLKPQEELKTEEEREAEVQAQKQARASLWQSFQSSVKGSRTPETPDDKPQHRLVKIERRYKFAGEIISEVVEVPEDSEDAKKWPLVDQGNDESNAVEVGKSETTTGAVETQKPEAPSSAMPHPASASPIPTPTSFTTESNTTPGPSVREISNQPDKAPSKPRAGPRKPKTILAPLPSQSKPKKLTTLEKSAMDWQAHIRSAGGSNSGEKSQQGDNFADELERNRRGGGYLEKVDFLERVNDRREGLYENSRSKRRKV